MKKACGKINPEIQNDGGDPFSIHLVQNAIRSRSSVIQDASGLSDKKASDHFFGT